MKLDRDHRLRILDAVMADVPSPDSLKKEIETAALSAIIAAMPEKVRMVWNDPATRCWINPGFFLGGLESIKVPCPQEWNGRVLNWLRKVDPIAIEKIDRLNIQKRQEDTDRSWLRGRLRDALFSVGSTTAFVRAHPYLARYCRVKSMPKNAARAPLDEVYPALNQCGWKDASS